VLVWLVWASLGGSKNEGGKGAYDRGEIGEKGRAGVIIVVRGKSFPQGRPWNGSKDTVSTRGDGDLEKRGRKKKWLSTGKNTRAKAQ